MTALLAAGLVGAACGGAAAGGAGPAAPQPDYPSGSPPAALPAPAVSSSAATATVAPPVASAIVPLEMKPPMASAMVADLQALGLDAKNLPPIEKLEPKTLRGAMKLIARSLGAKCTDCHVDGDFAASTRDKKIAAKMWDEFVGKLTMQGGAPLFCDSCHQGRFKLLDRGDKKALGKWMDASFVAPMTRKDGKTQECESCHVDWNMTFLTSWGR